MSSDLPIQDLLKLAVSHHRAGQFRAAQELYEQILKQQPDLKNSARKVIGDVSALDVVRHQVELDLALLLSNPLLPKALRARLGPPQK